MKEFDEVNRKFVEVHGDNFGIIDIKIFTFWSLDNPIIDRVSVYFVVRKEKERGIFENQYLRKCSDEYLVCAKKVQVFQDLKFDFYVLSQEEVKKKYGGNYYYAMH